MIYTVFLKPENKDYEIDLPQDFATYEEAVRYAEENYHPTEYFIESTEGEVI